MVRGRIICMAIVIVTVLTMVTVPANAVLRHIGPGPDKIYPSGWSITLHGGQTTTLHRGNETIKLTDINIAGKIDCIGNAETPVDHVGAFGQRGVITVNDYIDCFAPGVYYQDTISLYRYPDLVAFNNQSGWLAASYYGWLEVNETSYICNIPFFVGYYGIQTFTVGAIGYGAARNYPPGFIGPSLGVTCA